MKQGLSRLQIFEIAKHRVFWVHKYRYCNSKLRAKIRRMCKDGLLQIVHNTRDELGIRAINNKALEIN